MMQVLEKCGDVRALVIGDVMVDRYIHGSCDRVSPEAPVPVVRFSEEIKNLGGAANVALNLKCLGVNVDLCGIVQEDDAGQWLRKEIERQGIGDRLVSIYRSMPIFGPTIQKTRIVAGGQQVCRLDREAPNTEQPVSGVLSSFLDFSEYDVIFVSDYGKTMVRPDLMMELMNQKVPYFCDPKDPNLEKYAGSAGITPNQKEMIAFKAPYPGDLVQNFENLGILSVLCTLGDNGAHYWESGMGLPNKVEPKKVELADACGAGDTAFALYGLSKTVGASTEEAAEIANIGASEVCKHPGVVPITRLQMVNLLSEG
jgi:D-beta-D-heptose 7-phosphate kinase/D-beta-D-heptose 1-phosphate adenosyltransferase